MREGSDVAQAQEKCEMRTPRTRALRVVGDGARLCRRPAAAARLPDQILPSKPALRWEAAAAGFGSTAALRRPQLGYTAGPPQSICCIDASKRLL